MNLLVTGCYGFIGFNFLNFLIKNKIEVNIIGIDSLKSTTSKLNKKIFEENNNIKFYETDINSINELTEINNEHIDGIINFAAETHVDNSISNPEIFIESNISGTNSLLRYAVKKSIKNFLHISTDEVYGSAGNYFFNENDKFNPSSPYSASKASAELICGAYNKTYGLKIKICRPANNYGIYQQPEKFIPYSIANLINDKNIELYGKGLNIRHWLHVDDTASAIFKIFNYESDNGVYNIGSDTYLKNVEVANLILKILKLDDDRITFVDDRPGHDFKYAVDLSKLYSIGWKPKHNFEEELEKIIFWYKNNEEWWKEEYKKVIKNRLKRKELI